MAAIRRFARRIAAGFRPEKIILFGSFAYGRPSGDSDVDILVIMPTSDTTGQAIRIRLAIEPPFPLDLIVRTPATIRWRLPAGDWFLREIIGKGKVLYEAPDGRMGAKGGSRSPRRKKTLRGQTAAP